MVVGLLLASWALGARPAQTGPPHHPYTFFSIPCHMRDTSSQLGNCKVQRMGAISVSPTQEHLQHLRALNVLTRGSAWPWSAWLVYRPQVSSHRRGPSLAGRLNLSVPGSSPVPHQATPLPSRPRTWHGQGLCRGRSSRIRPRGSRGRGAGSASSSGTV